MDQAGAHAVTYPDGACFFAVLGSGLGMFKGVFQAGLCKVDDGLPTPSGPSDFFHMDLKGCMGGRLPLWAAVRLDALPNGGY